MSNSDSNICAPEGLVLDEYTVSGDGGRTRSTMADVVKNIDGLASAVASMTQLAAETQEKAQNAATNAYDAMEAAGSALEEVDRALKSSDVYIPDHDAVPGMVKGMVQGATGRFTRPIIGQGYQQTWNDPSGRAGTSHINIKPSGVGGHWFYDIETYTTSLDTDAWGAALYSGWGYAHFGKPKTSASVWIGRPDSGSWQYLNYFCAPTSFIWNNDVTHAKSVDVGWVARGGSGQATDGTLSFRGSMLGPDTNDFTDLGTADNRFRNLYLSGNVQMTSDIKVKRVIEDLLDLDASYRDKLLAFYDALHPKLFRYKADMTEGAREAPLHVGVVAQDVEAAMLHAGLDPADWALWSQQQRYEQVQIPEEMQAQELTVNPETGEKKSFTPPVQKYRYETRPVLDENGQPIWMQALIYAELQMLLSVCERLKREAVEQKQADLEKRLAALEAAHGV
ncbi:tail fiber domain-containing protein [Candidatus Kirkpatrickella diaphorinae]|uniref:Tail fiber domain-containing protein n=1 Tax=Candidatus Kirkpatrickella diaphorinae TaxID=2984322 RepID=A0ABY6GJV7_9PROT|nr:tail fiber domain-containing protein [Candidatus Kirkpatrickella diaphorinae]UYH51827.1 tail fiber domain-containing protein [Candidatus Kirkpatrickella diaphorinae]